MAEQVKMILVDIHQNNRINIHDLFPSTSNLNVKVDVYHSITSILSHLPDFRYNCILMDCILKDRENFKEIEQIRKKDRSIPIVVIVNEDDEGYGPELINFGASFMVDYRRLDQNKHNLIALIKTENKRKKVEYELKINKQKLDEAQRLSKIGSWEYTLSDNTVVWSEEMFRIFEKDPEVFIPTSQHFVTLFHPDDQPLIRDGIDMAMAGEVINLDLRILLPKNRIKHVYFNAFFQMDENDNFEVFVGTIQDIDERKKAEEELVLAKQIADESRKVKEQFLANMSHEIRTPMNSIIGFTELMLKRKDNLTQEQIKYIDAIHSSGNNLLVIINDILDFSKMESGNMSIESYRFNLRSLLQDTLKSFELTARKKDLELSCKIDDAIPDFIFGDSVRINQVLINLLSNAIKFTHDGFIRLKVQLVSWENDEVLLRFEIKDSGIGVEAHKLANIFNSFTQANSDTARKFGGTGLGLAIVKSIVELMNGEIHVSSTVKVGTTFTFELPFSMKGSEKETTVYASNGQGLSESSQHEYHLLMAEDNPLNQELAKIVIREIGWKLDIVNNGLEALEKIQQKKYDAILMDIQMPELDGYETTLRIRNEFTPPLSTIPIIAITAHAIKKEIDKCFTVGMDEYVPKPFKQLELKEKVLSAINSYGHTPPSKPKIISKPVRPHESSSLLNLEQLREMPGITHDTYHRILNVFLKEMKAPYRDLMHAVETKDWKLLKTLSHKLKSSYAILGAKQVKEILETIERSCMERDIDATKFALMIKKLIPMHKEVYQCVQNEIKQEMVSV